MDIIVREVSEDLANRLTELAKAEGMSREAWLRAELKRLADTPPLNLKYGEGIKAFTHSGGTVILKRLTESIQSGATNLSQQEFSAYERAKLLADPKNGSRWDDAIDLLIEVGFEVFRT